MKKQFPKIFHTGEFKFAEFPQLIAKTRNYNTHYNQKQEDKALKGEDLLTSFHILRNKILFTKRIRIQRRFYP